METAPYRNHYFHFFHAAETLIKTHQHDFRFLCEENKSYFYLNIQDFPQNFTALFGK